MLRVALTGGIATGKSTVLSRFAARGVPVIDADQVAREVVAPGTEGARQIAERFGPAYLTADGEIDRTRLAQHVFGDEAARRDLEAIVHPKVYEAVRHWSARLDEDGQTPLAIADIPLLFETGRAGDFDRVVVAACDPEEQVRRVMARDGATDNDARARLAAQWPIADKVRRADYVIDTNGSLDDTLRQVDVLHARLLQVGPYNVR